MIGLLLLCAAMTAADEKPSAGRPAEMKVLHAFLGEWETDVTSHPAARTPKTVRTRGLAVGKATMGGRYVEYRARSRDGRHGDLQIMTYDGAAGCFRHWYFNSEGDTHVAVGKWDPRSRVLTWSGQEDGASFHIEDRFVDKDTIEWSGVTKNESGSVLLRLEGTLRRRPPEERNAREP